MTAGQHVLIVEDETLILEMLAAEFEDAGVATSRAMSGDEAIAIFEEHNDFSIVITDIRMPGQVDGLALLRWLNQNHPNVPVFVTTGFAEKALDSLVPAPAAIFRKPYQPSAVVKAVLAGCRGSQA